MKQKQTFDELEIVAEKLIKAAKLNASERQELQTVVGGFAEEIQKGLTFVIFRIQGGVTIAISKERGRKQKLIKYQQDMGIALSENFSEFQICQGLRTKRDELRQLFNPASWAVSLFKKNELKDLLFRLQSDEYTIFEEVNDALYELDVATRKSLKEYVRVAEKHIEKIRKRQRQIRRKSRKVFELQ